MLKVEAAANVDEKDAAKSHNAILLAKARARLFRALGVAAAAAQKCANETRLPSTSEIFERKKRVNARNMKIRLTIIEMQLIAARSFSIAISFCAIFSLLPLNTSVAFKFTFGKIFLLKYANAERMLS